MQDEEGTRGPEHSGHFPMTRVVGSSLGVSREGRGVERDWSGGIANLFGVYSVQLSRIYPEEGIRQAIQLWSGPSTLFGSEVGSSLRVVDPHLSYQSRLVGINHAHMDQPRILGWPVKNPAGRRRCRLNRRAGSGRTLLSERPARLPQSTGTRRRQGGGWNPKGGLVVGILNDQPVLEHNRFDRSGAAGGVTTSYEPYAGHPY
jgi:hypothetical protein